MFPFNVGDDGFNEALERELDSVAEELLTLLELDDATWMAAPPTDPNSAGRANRGDLGLPSTVDDDQDRELIRTLLEDMESGHSSSGNCREVNPRVAAAAAPAAEGNPTPSVGVSKVAKAASTTAKMTRSGYCSCRKPSAPICKSSKRNRRRGAASHTRAARRKRARPRRATKAGRLHRRRLRRGSSKRQCRTPSSHCSCRTPNRSAAAAAKAAAEAARPRQPTSGACGCGYKRVERRAATLQTEGSDPGGDAVVFWGGCGGGTSDTNGGCCGTSRRVPSSGGVMDPSSRFFCTGLSFMRRAVGAHALFAWAGEAVRASDRYAVSRGISLGGGLHACACGRPRQVFTAFSVLLFSLKLYFHGGRCPPSKYTRVPGHSAFVARTAAIQCVPVHEKAGLVSARLQRPENVFPFLRDLNRFIEHPPR